MIITSEQVGRGHPDKICDQVSDYILDKILSNDKNARVGIEAAIGKKILFITGEAKTNFNYQKGLKRELRQLLTKIDPCYKSYKIVFDIGKQSVEINKKVDQQKLAAGDQGLMYGYATDETNDFLPTPYSLCNYIMRHYYVEIDKVKGSNSENKSFISFFPQLKEDTKIQVCYDYKIHKFVNINFSFQHCQQPTWAKYEQLKADVGAFLLKIIKQFCLENDLPVQKNFSDILTLNYAGTFILGGALSDAGLTGRKIVADTYGGLGRHGGGAFSGKDYTKVDRSASYYARYVARKVVETKLAKICEIQVSYIIGQQKPVAIDIETFETNTISQQEIKKYIDDNFDFSVSKLIDELDLKNVEYSKLTLFGHFGKKTIWG